MTKEGGIVLCGLVREGDLNTAQSGLLSGRETCTMQCVHPERSPFTRMREGFREENSDSPANS